MSISARPTPTRIEQRPLRRLWKTPASRAWWLWLLACFLFYTGLFYLYYRDTLHGSPLFSPGNGPLAKFGLVALGMIGLTATYTLRRRFMRFLPGQARNWLWMHNWLGITTVLIVMLHANFDYIARDYCLTPQCLSGTYYGPFALYGVILLVGSGITGRLIDVWQTRIIARDANANGVGIAQALEERIQELAYAIERYYAGKSEPFQHYCAHTLKNAGDEPIPLPALPPYEQADFQQTRDLLAQRARLLHSLQRQQRARRIISRWRIVHITLACIAVCLIGTHLGILVLGKLRFFHV
jgi:hypothetical protein